MVTWLTPQRCRTLWVNVHLALSLSVGLVFMVIGLTGSLLAFWPKLDLWMYPDVAQVTPKTAEEKRIRSLDTLETKATGTKHFPHHELRF